MYLSLSCPVYHLWIDGSLKLDSPSFCHHVHFITSEWQNFELGGFSIGHVQSITSELTDSQVSSFSLMWTSLLSSCPVRHLWTTKFWVWQFLTSYVQFVTSELMDSRSHSYSPQWTSCQVNTMTSEQQIVNLAFLSWSFPNYLWTDGCLALFPFMVLKLSCPVYDLWIDESITLFSYPLSRPEIFAVMNIKPLNSRLWV